MKIISLMSGLLFVLFTACGASKKIIQPAAPLYETKWLLKKINADGISQEVSTKAFLKFDEQKKSAGGNGSCNSFGSSTTINGNEVTFKNIFSTKMYCEEVQKIENAYLNNLGKANRFEIKGNILVLYNDKELLLEFATE